MVTVKSATTLGALLPAGSPAKGDYRCAECGYGIVATHRLPVCPMCRSEQWLEQRWTPFGERASSEAV
jgi:hypothetical protein